MTAQLKICGITRVEDLEACAALGVDAIGLNLWSGSRRGLPLDRAKALLAAAPTASQSVLKVGVFVHATPAEVRAAAAELRLDAIQIHDDGPFEPYAELGWPWVWVIRGTPDLETCVLPSPAPAWILLDAVVAGFGGQGHLTDWVWAARAVGRWPRCPVWLAGGITPDNAGAALDRVRPAGLDVASGAEFGSGTGSGLPPGSKDHDRIAALLAACRAATP